MYIAIDDTYGPDIETDSIYISGKRRTHAAIIFKDIEVSKIRRDIKACLQKIENLTGIVSQEFHFVDIYNKNPPWDSLADKLNLILFEFFASIYSEERWPVIIQTVDDRTFSDHKLEIKGKIDGLNLSNYADVSLQMLLVKIKRQHIHKPEDITIIIDEGKGKPGKKFPVNVFHDWPCKYDAYFDSSCHDPLLQLADFIAYCVNRSTHLQMKKKKTKTDLWFLNLVGTMNLNSKDITNAKLSTNFSAQDIDRLHKDDRLLKGL